MQENFKIMFAEMNRKIDAATADIIASQPKQPAQQKPTQKQPERPPSQKVQQPVKHVAPEKGPPAAVQKSTPAEEEYYDEEYEDETAQN